VGLGLCTMVRALLVVKRPHAPVASASTRAQRWHWAWVTCQAALALAQLHGTKGCAPTQHERMRQHTAPKGAPAHNTKGCASAHTWASRMSSSAFRLDTSATSLSAVAASFTAAFSRLAISLSCVARQWAAEAARWVHATSRMQGGGGWSTQRRHCSALHHLFASSAWRACAAWPHSQSPWVRSKVLHWASNLETERGMSVCHTPSCGTRWFGCQGKSRGEGPTEVALEVASGVAAFTTLCDQPEKLGWLQPIAPIMPWQAPHPTWAASSARLALISSSLMSSRARSMATASCAASSSFTALACGSCRKRAFAKDHGHPCNA